MMARGADRAPVTAVPRAATGQRRASAEFPAAAGSVPQAREFVRGVLAKWARPEYDEAAALLASELVTNVVLHAHTSAAVTLTDTGAHVVLAVSDGSAALPVLRRHSREAVTGRGLWLLDQYSAEHGTSENDAGKTVWAVLRREVTGVSEGDDSELARWLDGVEAL